MKTYKQLINEIKSEKISFLFTSIHNKSGKNKYNNTPRIDPEDYLSNLKPKIEIFESGKGAGRISTTWKITTDLPVEAVQKILNKELKYLNTKVAGISLDYTGKLKFDKVKF